MSEQKPTQSDDLKPEHNFEAEIEALQEKVTELEEEVTNLEDKNTRLLAEQSNIANRLTREFDLKQSYAISKFAKEMLEVADVLQTGLENCDDKENDHYRGMEMTLDKFFIILKQHGITPIESENQPFDPNLHEALTSQENNEVDSGTILHVVQNGYQFKDRVLRPAKVIVSKKVSQES